jgi:hypothetical protein
LAASTFFSARLLGGEHVAAWVRARAISEGLKREAYKFAAEATPYDGTDRVKAGELLDDERAKVEDDGSDLLSLQATAAGAGSTPRAPVSHDDYIARRINGQIAWFVKKAASYRDAATLLRRVEFGLALAATLITAIASVIGKTAPLRGRAVRLRRFHRGSDHGRRSRAGACRSVAVRLSGDDLSCHRAAA